MRGIVTAFLLGSALLSLVHASGQQTEGSPGGALRHAHPTQWVEHLRDGWMLQSGCVAKQDGPVISSTAFTPHSWLRISVPSTVLAAQIAAGIYKDPFYARNLRTIPGTSYPLGENFSNLPMPPDSPYRCAWWYRKQFSIPGSEHGRNLWLRFGGINYRANIWVNGKLLASSSEVAGAYRTYEFDVSKVARSGKENVVAVQTFAPTELDLGVNWVDWNPCPPDKDMGLTGNVDLNSSGPISVRSPFVATHFPDASLKTAELSVYGELHNASSRPVDGIASATLLGMNLQQPVTLAAGESKTIAFTPEDHPELKIQNPQVWWPYQMGTPHLQRVQLRFSESGRISDEQDTEFGIREITSELTDKGYRLFRVNGKAVLIRGGGWSQDMLLREDPERLRQQFALTRDMHLNAIRLEGKLETDDFFRLADEQGILVMAGWCCCDQWEHWDKWTPENFEVANASVHSQMLRLRNHPSLIVWLNGSDGPPPANVEQAYLDIENTTKWPNPTLSSASAHPTTVSGGSGVKMPGPYDFVAPSYWLVDQSRYGGAFGFNTETSPGPAIPTIYSLRRFLPADQLWPPNDDWSYHYGGEGFQKLTAFQTAMDETYGPTGSLDEYERTAQAMAYDGERAMFEAYARNKYTSTGVIQWMLNNAWPSMIWHLYDYYLEAAGGYFGAKKANEPLHIQYSYDDHSVVVVNSRYQPTEQLHASVHVYDPHLQQLFSETADVTAPADSSTKAMSIPENIFSDGSQLVFVQLELDDSSGQPVSKNFYWVPAALTEFDWSKTDYTHTPALKHEAMTELRNLPAAQIEAQLLSSNPGAEVKLQLHNPSPALAFRVSARALDKNSDAVEPVFWSDNYLDLMPNETRTLTCQGWPGAKDRIASLIVSGWNVQETRVPIAPGKTIAER